MGGEQAATVLATITKDQRAREGKEVMIRINHPKSHEGLRVSCGTANIREAPPRVYKENPASVTL